MVTSDRLSPIGDPLSDCSLGNILPEDSVSSGKPRLNAELIVSEDKISEGMKCIEIFIFALYYNIRYRTQRWLAHSIISKPVSRSIARSWKSTSKRCFTAIITRTNITPYNNRRDYIRSSVSLNKGSLACFSGRFLARAQQARSFG